MTGRAHISLLGGFAVEVDGTVIPDASWRLRKSRSVLKLLALTPGRSLHPERLQALLWPDRDPVAAGNNLRQVVYHARRALTGAGGDGAGLLASRGDLLALADGVEVDVDTFEVAAERAARSGTPADVESALAAYGGELLPEDMYEDWAIERRRSLAERHVALLLALAATRDPASATDVLHRAIAADHLNEEAHRAMLRAYAASGRRPQALAHYDELRRTLARELGGDPEPETRTLYRELLAEGAPEPASADARSGDLSAAGEVAAGPLPARHNLPWQPTSFVGRTRELAELERTLDGRRLVTLTGPGGCGKTRLAFELGRRRVERHADGVWVVELAGIADPGLVGHATATALGLDLSPGEASEEGLARHLADRHLLLVIDNCEHLLAACTRLVETLLARCPGVGVLTTSREPLHLPGEVDWRVPSMTMVDTSLIDDVAELASADAVELFCDRALSANPRFKLSLANAQAVAEICLRVDGLPLAIELAAARTTALSPAEIAARLEHGLAVLRANRAGGLTRQQTLEGTLDWSHNLLDERERVLFRRLSVFSGGFELEAAEAICADGEVAQEDVLDLLAGLVDKSLVGADDAGDTYRYRLLEPVRQYAAARLRHSREEEALTERHAGWFAAATAAPGGRVSDLDPDWVDRLERDHDNLRAAMFWLLDKRPERAVEMAPGMAGLWLLRAHLREGSRWLDRALDAAPAATPARAEALHARQALERRRPFNYDFADRLSEERIAIHRDQADQRSLCIALLDHADGQVLRGRFDATLALADEARELAEALDDTGLRGAVREREGLALAWRQEVDAAGTAFEDAFGMYDLAADDERPTSAVVSLGGSVAEAGRADTYPQLRLEETSLHFRRLPPRLARASLLSHRSYLHRLNGDHAAARADLEFASAILGDGGSSLDVARLVAQRGALETHAGDLDAAAHWLEKSLELRTRLREHRGILLTLVDLAVVAGKRGDGARAAELLARADRMAEEAADGPGMGGVILAAAEIARVDGDFESARNSLDRALTVFFGLTGFIHWASWMHAQHAWLSLELDDRSETARRLDLAWAGFTEARMNAGLDYCRALGARLQAANGMLTPAQWSPSGEQAIKEEL